MQWNLPITDTLGAEKQFVIPRFPLFGGAFIYITIYLDPQKQSVIERFLLLEELVMRGSTVQSNLISEYTWGPSKLLLTISSTC